MMECPVAGPLHDPIDEGDGPADLLVNLVTHLHQQDVEYLEAKCHELLDILRPVPTEGTTPIA